MLALLLGQFHSHFDLIGAAQLPQGECPEEGVSDLLANFVGRQPQRPALFGQFQVELQLPSVVVVVDVPGCGVILELLFKFGIRLLEDVDVAVAQVDFDILAVSGGPPFGLEGDLVDPRDFAHLVAPQRNDVVGGHVAFVGRLHHDLDVDETAAADVCLDPVGDPVEVVFVEHLHRRFRDRRGGIRRLYRGRADRHASGGLDLVGRHLGHHDHSHMPAVSVSADDDE